MKIQQAPRLLTGGLLAGVLLFAGCTNAEPKADATPVTSDRPAPAVATSAAEPVPVTYVVALNDSLVSIAAAHEIEVSDILALNETDDPSFITPGLRLQLPGLVQPETAASAPADTSVVAPTPTDQAWYNSWLDRVPPFPEQLEPAQPVLLALGAVAAAVFAVGLMALAVQILYGVLGAGASGVAFGGNKLQAAVAGIPINGHGGGIRRQIARPFGWRPRLQIARSSIALGRPGFASRRSAPTATAERDAVRTPRGPGAIARFRGNVSRRAAGLWATVRSAAAQSASAIANSGRATASRSRRLLVAAAHTLLRMLRAAAIGARTGTLRIASVPAGYIAARREAREQRQFREGIESSAAARMRLGLRDDAELHLQKSLTESLNRGWRLEAAWCLQLLAEEADRRGDRALAELRRVRARELIRDHALADEQG